MASNFPGPYEVEIFYTVDGLQHIQRLNFDATTELFPGDDADVETMVTRGGVVTPSIGVAVEAWTTLAGARFDQNSGDWDSFNVWKYTPGTFDRIFITSEQITSIFSGGTVSRESQQDIYSFRTQEGGVMRVMLMETRSISVDCVNYGDAGSQEQDIVDFIVSEENWMLARDTSYPIAFVRVCGGQNEKTFKQRHR